ncbi:MAG: leucine-rich repeat protein [Oscillospiraceae bacterium]|nr:leucine-rich repeat protein [Oscillospiraceae bacterium]
MKKLVAILLSMAMLSTTFAGAAITDDDHIGDGETFGEGEMLGDGETLGDNETFGEGETFGDVETFYGGETFGESETFYGGETFYDDTFDINNTPGYEEVYITDEDLITAEWNFDFDGDDFILDNTDSTEKFDDCGCTGGGHTDHCPGRFRYTVSGGEATITGYGRYIAARNETTGRYYTIGFQDWAVPTDGHLIIPDKLGVTNDFAGYPVVAIESAVNFHPNLPPASFPTTGETPGAWENDSGAVSFTPVRGVFMSRPPSPPGAIGDFNAFQASITKVTLPETLVTIGENTFSGCGALRYFERANSSGDEQDVTGSTYPDSVSRIYKSAFLATAWLEVFTHPSTGVVRSSIGGGPVYFGKVAYLYVDPIAPGNFQISLRDDTKGIAEEFSRSTRISNLTTSSGANFPELIWIGPSALVVGDTSPWSTPYGNDFIIGNVYWLRRNPPPGQGFIPRLTIPEGIVHIADNAFSGTNIDINEFIMPTTLKSIGRRAFFNKNTITSVNLPEGFLSIEREAFRGCTSIGRFDFPTTFTHLGDMAFRGCTTLQTIGFEQTQVTVIGNEAFRECTRLDSVTLGEKIEIIGSGAFRGCTNLNSVVMINSPNLRYVGNDAFNGCTAATFTFAYLPDSVVYLGRRAFANCTNLETIRLPKELKVVEQDTFRSCAKLSRSYNPDEPFDQTKPPEPTVILPSGLLVIDRGAFQRCTGLTEIVVPDSVVRIEEKAFYIFASGVRPTPLPRPVMKKAHIGDGVRYIGRYAFQNHVDIESIYVGESVEVIDWSAFQNNASLVELYLGSQLWLINSNAFRDCISLPELVTPDSLRVIANEAFRDCWSLADLTLNEGLVELSFGAFGISYLGTGTMAGNSPPPPTSTERQIESALRHVRIPDSVTLLTEGNTSGTEPTLGVFENNRNLETAHIGRGVYRIPARIFMSCIRLRAATINVSPPPGPQIITEVGLWAFRNCSSLRTVNIPYTINIVQGNAFTDSGVVAMVFIDGMEELVSRSFQNAKSLKAIMLPETMQRVREYAFEGCDSLESVVMRTMQPPIDPTTLQSPFSGLDLSKITIIVPVGAKENYEAHEFFKDFEIIESDFAPLPVTFEANPAHGVIGEVSAKVSGSIICDGERCEREEGETCPGGEEVGVGDHEFRSSERIGIGSIVEFFPETEPWNYVTSWVVNNHDVGGENSTAHTELVALESLHVVANLAERGTETRRMISYSIQSGAVDGHTFFEAFWYDNDGNPVPLQSGGLVQQGRTVEFRATTIPRINDSGQNAGTENRWAVNTWTDGAGPTPPPAAILSQAGLDRYWLEVGSTDKTIRVQFLANGTLNQSNQTWSTHPGRAPIGDINFDGVVNEKDLELLQNYVDGDTSIRHPNLTDAQFNAVFNINRDTMNRINAADVEYLRNYLDDIRGYTLGTLPVQFNVTNPMPVLPPETVDITFRYTNPAVSPGINLPLNFLEATVDGVTYRPEASGVDHKITVPYGSVIEFEAKTFEVVSRVTAGATESTHTDYYAINLWTDSAHNQATNPVLPAAGANKHWIDAIGDRTITVNFMQNGRYTIARNINTGVVTRNWAVHPTRALIGDINLDYVVDETDLELLTRYLSGDASVRNPGLIGNATKDAQWRAFVDIDRNGFENDWDKEHLEAYLNGTRGYALGYATAAFSVQNPMPTNDATLTFAVASQPDGAQNELIATVNGIEVKSGDDVRAGSVVEFTAVAKPLDVNGGKRHFAVLNWESSLDGQASHTTIPNTDGYVKIWIVYNENMSVRVNFTDNGIRADNGTWSGTGSTNGRPNRILTGDINEDGIVDANDLTALRNFLTRRTIPSNLTPAQMAQIVDINRDGRANIADLTYIKRVLVKQRVFSPAYLALI